ncbi:pyrimidine-nucleoside phosphorylase [Candidatus Syntrophocurvum alkaliphilum]|nr:pyrimidine-nucleoside phosphorylase [Candidatus Syntrophocurvum alkaliphilum]
MRMSDIIEKKRNGGQLQTSEIDFFIKGYTNDKIPDYQVSALLMVIYYQGMNKQEVADLTNAMVESGDTIDLTPIKGKKVDKHSTGGVGDKTSFIVAPLVAYMGIPVAKMSGRGLGHTGGTIDKLESIEGFNAELNREQFLHNVNKYKIAIISQSGNLTPADKKLYALRDVTATVDSIPLIASSIMSKKIASGADAIVLDVKTGSGAFMKSIEEAKELAKTMVDIGKSLNKKTVAIISDMNQPLGYEIGNANEVKEAIEVLKGKKVDDLRKVSLAIASHMTILGGIFKDYSTAYKELEKVLDSGLALETFKSFIQAQGGNPDIVDNPSKLPQSKYKYEIKSPKKGFISEIEAQTIGRSAMLLGAGRKTKDEPIDHSAGITLTKKIGDKVDAGEIIALLQSNIQDVHDSIEILSKAINISDKPVKEISMVYDIID